MKVNCQKIRRQALLCAELHLASLRDSPGGPEIFQTLEPLIRGRARRPSGSIFCIPLMLGKMLRRCYERN